MEQVSIMIVGVGGQGTLLASRLLGAALLSSGCGYDVKVSEVHGMSQRGGSVVTYVKFGERVASPIIDLGEADVILAFEQLEAARWLPYLKPEGKVIVNTQRIDPMPVITGAAEYPQGIVEHLRAAGVAVQAIDALALAMESGSAKAVNVVLLGALAKQLLRSSELADATGVSPGIPRGTWEEAVRSTVKPQFAEMNLKAFALGWAA
ncbi:MAG: indolepyruvate oxidoreductase subunit beta [Oscillospiraceae bacterium]|jgi:indolepyruvate ferredoxin oxidoreductase beta subunit|nr:indolepyruvate oxidoreductase subunit beta [Oscillospiraceae bacterium]